VTGGFEFHGLGAEVLAFATQAAARDGLWFTAIARWKEWPPVCAAPTDVQALVIDVEHAGWLCLTASRPDLEGVQQDHDFLQRNPDRLCFRLGEMTAQGLESGMLQYPSGAHFNPLWRRIGTAFKRSLSQGGWVYWPRQQAKRLDKALLFTDGAIALHRSGDARLLGAGAAYVHVPGLEGDDPVLAGAEAVD
jgi:hypothetical protein